MYVVSPVRQNNFFVNFPKKSKACCSQPQAQYNFEDFSQVHMLVKSYDMDKACGSPPQAKCHFSDFL